MWCSRASSMQRLHLLKLSGIRLKILRLVTRSARFCPLPFRLIFTTLMLSMTASFAAEWADIALRAWG